jgi:hypothetical protein
MKGLMAIWLWLTPLFEPKSILQLCHIHERNGVGSFKNRIFTVAAIPDDGMWQSDSSIA